MSLCLKVSGCCPGSADGSDREQRIFLRADKSVPYGELMRVMNLLRTKVT